MAFFFFFTMLSAAGCFVLGLINPGWLRPLVRGIWTRGRIALVFSGAAIFSFFGVGLTAPPVEHVDSPVVAQQEQDQSGLSGVNTATEAQEKDEGVSQNDNPQEVPADDSEEEARNDEPETAAVEETQSAPAVSADAAPTTSTTSSANYYTNVDGDVVESPSTNTNGATGVCNDGTYTHAVHHQGACSHHGGVSYWL